MSDTQFERRQPTDAQCHTLRTAHYIGIAELVPALLGPATWECRVWDRDSAECVAEATLYTEHGAREWLAAICTEEAQHHE